MSSLKELQDLIQEKYGIDPATLDPQESMREKGFDSLAIVEFLFEVEDRLKVSLPDPDPSIETLAGLAAVVDRARAEQQQQQVAAAEPPAAAE
ncbi:acyl carrier protein [Xenophilus arseniciresistens]|uniref:Acyl carrier protein n=1 Tax=Xenophilus arseniciresistens TaxID=1283306 RepID=A0AAE3N4L5_9BURK|nr:acyl carrier protein [Xenophilus arseniciresistens]MDA7415420.1 acyl carrier protein [Xenophilus arseniciresistens]